MSEIQTHRIPSTRTTATVVMLAIIAVAALLQLHVIPLVLTVPLFLVPLSIYVTMLGLKNRQRPHITQNYSYYFTWGGIMVAVGVGWITLYENMGVIIGAIAILSIALAYVYLNKIKSSMKVS